MTSSLIARIVKKVAFHWRGVHTMALFQPENFERGDTVYCRPGTSSTMMQRHNLSHGCRYHVIKFVYNPLGKNKLELVDDDDVDMGMIDAGLFMKRNPKHLN